MVSASSCRRRRCRRRRNTPSANGTPARTPSDFAKMCAVRCSSPTTAPPASNEGVSSASHASTHVNAAGGTACAATLHPMSERDSSNTSIVIQLSPPAAGASVLLDEVRGAEKDSRRVEGRTGCNSRGLTWRRIVVLNLPERARRIVCGCCTLAGQGELLLADSESPADTTCSTWFMGSECFGSVTVGHGRSQRASGERPRRAQRFRHCFIVR